MRKILSLLLALTFCFMTVACAKDGNDVITTTTVAPEHEKSPEPLLAGFAERDFTPEGGQIPGCTVEVVAGVEVPLFANAAAFEIGDESLILI